MTAKHKLLPGMGCLLFSIFCACSSSSNQQTTLAVPVASCVYAGAKQCFEYFTPTMIQAGEGSCLNSKGTWSSKQACKTEGRVKGCQGDVNGVKAYVFWSYESESGADVVKAFCDGGGSYDVQGETVSVVNP